MAIRVGVLSAARATSVETQADRLRVSAQSRLSGAQRVSAEAARNPVDGTVPSFSRVSMIDFDEPTVPRVAGRWVEPDDSDW